jgi:hypothetical protein
MHRKMHGLSFGVTHMHRWFTATFTLDDSDHEYVCELFAYKTGELWNVGGPIEHTTEGQAHKNIWSAIGALFDANDATCIALREIDRAGNPI